MERLVRIPMESGSLEGALAIPEGSKAVVLFAHGSGSSRHSPRNRFVADVILRTGTGTLLFDLLTTEEDTIYENRFDIPLLTERLEAATQWFRKQPGTGNFRIGYFGASTGAAAAIAAAAHLGPAVSAVVSRGGRPDLAQEALPRVQAPTLLIVGGLDDIVIGLNQKAYDRINAERKLMIIPGATHLFGEPGKLEEVARLAAEWFSRHLKPAR